MGAGRRLGILGLCIVGASCFHTSAFHERIQQYKTGGGRRTTTISFDDVSIATTTTCRQPKSSTQLNMFMGSDGGILGVGGPELFTILLVGYFVLGPSDLYKLVKEIGKFIQNVRTLGSDLTTTFESNMESAVQMEELRKAQRELNDAFSFRRSINTEEEAQAFSVTAGSAQAAEAKREEELAAKAETTGAPRQKKIRRRVKRKAPPPLDDSLVSESTETPAELDLPVPSPVNATAVTTNVPDLEMPHADDSSATVSDDELASIESEFAKYTSTPDPAAESRFQQQLSGQWNDEIMKNTKSLEPMGALMEQVALLEQERKAALDRLEDEFAKRKEIEMEFYRARRSAIEEKITETQEKAFGVSSKPL